MFALHHTLLFFLTSWWKLYDQILISKEKLLQSMDVACDDIRMESVQGWIRQCQMIISLLPSKGENCLRCR